MTTDTPLPAALDIARYRAVTTKFGRECSCGHWTPPGMWGYWNRAAKIWKCCRCYLYWQEELEKSLPEQPGPPPPRPKARAAVNPHR